MEKDDDNIIVSDIDMDSPREVSSSFPEENTPIEEKPAPLTEELGNKSIPLKNFSYILWFLGFTLFFYLIVYIAKWIGYNPNI